MNLDLLINNIKQYNNNEEDLEIIKKAYNLANDLHADQKRLSGEPYIIHPLNVAYILSDLEADTDTIVAGLLHDTIEDTKFTREDIANAFNDHVAILVDGVSKIEKMQFSSKEEEIATNTRKLLSGIDEDIRIIYIKLADRLHNMRTLQYKKADRQIAISKETLDIYVPIAEHLGFYMIRNELADCSLSYIKPSMYNDIQKRLGEFEFYHHQNMEETMNGMDEVLTKKSIDHELCPRIMSIYNIYQKLTQGINFRDIHNLYSIKVLVNTIDECYSALGSIHSKYKPNSKYFKDYIGSRKPNMYQSLHTTIFGEGGDLIQARIRTQEMNRLARFGLTAYWQDENIVMNEYLKNNFQFFKSLVQINESTNTNVEFLKNVRKDIFGKNIQVYTPMGDIIELPAGSTPIDFAYQVHTELGNKMIGSLINGYYVNFDCPLKDGDIVKIISSDSAKGPDDNWLSCCKTVGAKDGIKRYIKSKQN